MRSSCCQLAKKADADATSAATVSPGNDTAPAGQNLNVDQVIRPSAPPDVAQCKGIMSCFSFLFLSRCAETLCQKTNQLLV